MATNAEVRRLVYNAYKRGRWRENTTIQDKDRERKRRWRADPDNVDHENALRRVRDQATRDALKGK